MNSFFRVLPLAASLVAATSFAQTGGLTAAPSTVMFQVYHGSTVFKDVVVTNSSTGYASNITSVLSSLGRPIGQVEIISDTCRGATLAPNGTCKVRLEFDSTCPRSERASYTLTLTSNAMPPLVVPVSANSLGGICD